MFGLMRASPQKKKPNPRSGACIWGYKLNSGVKTHSFRILRIRCIFSSYKSCPWAAALPAGSELLCLGQEGDRGGPVAFTEPLE